MRDKSFLSVPFRAPDLNPIQQTIIQEILLSQAELAARSKRVTLLEVIRGFLSWPRRVIFIRRLRHL